MGTKTYYGEVTVDEDANGRYTVRVDDVQLASGPRGAVLEQAEYFAGEIQTAIENEIGYPDSPYFVAESYRGKWGCVVPADQVTEDNVVVVCRAKRRQHCRKSKIFEVERNKYTDENPFGVLFDTDVTLGLYDNGGASIRGHNGAEETDGSLHAHEIWYTTDLESVGND